MYESSISWHKVKRYLVKSYRHNHPDTLKNALKLFSAGAEPWTPLGELTTLPRPILGGDSPSPQHLWCLGASIFGASAKGPLFVESKKSLNYTMQHCSHPFGHCVQTDTNVTGLVVKGPRVSICPRAPVVLWRHCVWCYKYTPCTEKKRPKCFCSIIYKTWAIQMK